MKAGFCPAPLYSQQGNSWFQAVRCHRELQARAEQVASGYSARGYLPCSLEKCLGSLHAACYTEAAGSLTHLCPQWAWLIDLKSVFKHSALAPVSTEGAQSWKQTPTDVKGLGLS